MMEHKKAETQQQAVDMILDKIRGWLITGVDMNVYITQAGGEVKVIKESTAPALPASPPENKA